MEVGQRSQSRRGREGARSLDDGALDFEQKETEATEAAEVLARRALALNLRFYRARIENDWLEDPSFSSFASVKTLHIFEQKVTKATKGLVRWALALNLRFYRARIENDWLEDPSFSLFASVRTLHHF